MSDNDTKTNDTNGKPAEKPQMTVAEAGRRGGNKVREKYGPNFFKAIGKKGGDAVKAERGQEHYKTIGRKGGAAVRDSRGPEFYEEIGRKGGEANLRKHGKEHFIEMGRKGGGRLRELVEHGKRVESGVETGGGVGVETSETDGDGSAS